MRPLLSALVAGAALWVSVAAAQVQSPVVDFRVVGDAIPQPLTAAPPNPQRGRAVAADSRLGNCSICHHLPLPGVPEDAFGDIGPSLSGVGNRLSAGQLRLRIVDASRLNPRTLMPPYHRVESLERVAPAFRGRPILDARQVEDLVAFLLTLTKPAP